MKLIVRAICILSASIFVGCGTIYSVAPNAFVETPEILNSKSGTSSLALRYEPAQYFHLVDDASARPLKVTSPPDLEQSSLLLAGMNLSIGHQLEFTMTGYPIDFFQGQSYIIRPGVKWQFYGETGEKPDVTGSKASLFGHLIYTKISSEGHQDGLFGRGGYPWSASSEFSGIAAGFSYGYRAKRNILYYTGAAYEAYNVFAKVHQDVSATGDYPAADAEFPRTSGTSTTGSLGVVWGINRKLGLTYSYSDNSWGSFSDKVHRITVGLELGRLNRELSPLQPLE